MTTDKDSTLQEVIQILIKFTNAEEHIESNSHLMHDLELDSIKVMELIMLLEDNFDISIPLNVLPDVETVSHLSDKIFHLKQQANQ